LGTIRSTNEGRPKRAAFVVEQERAQLHGRARSPRLPKSPSMPAKEWPTSTTPPGELRQGGDDSVDHRIKRHFPERRLILALTG